MFLRSKYYKEKKLIKEQIKINVEYENIINQIFDLTDSTSEFYKNKDYIYIYKKWFELVERLRMIKLNCPVEPIKVGFSEPIAIQNYSYSKSGKDLFDNSSNFKNKIVKKNKRLQKQFFLNIEKSIEQLHQDFCQSINVAFTQRILEVSLVALKVDMDILKGSYSKSIRKQIRKDLKDITCLIALQPVFDNENSDLKNDILKFIFNLNNATYMEKSFFIQNKRNHFENELLKQLTTLSIRVGLIPKSN